MTDFTFNRSDFPENFLFGSATSSYQIEGHAMGGAGSTHWDTFAATPGNVVKGHNGAIACDHYNRWQSDLDLIKDAGLKGYRFSTSWARVLPEGRGQVNQDGLDYYDKLVDGMLERGLKPFPTLYHWEMPSALSDLGGWQNRDVADWFADYTEVIMKRIGDRVEATATINEPWCVTWLSHFLGVHAPGLRDIRATARACHHVLLAHGKAITAMRGLGMENLGVVFNFDYAQPASDSAEDLHAADLQDGIFNRWFADAVFKKSYPDVVLQGLLPYMPKDWEQDFDTIAAPVDWLGVNYYTRHLVKAGGTGMFPDIANAPGDLPKTALDWEIYPDGLHHFLTRMHKDYSGDLPIYVTENGMAGWDNLEGGVCNDAPRIDYLNQHFAAAKRAIDEGVPLKGYFVWSLLDNYEWAEGYDGRFGMVHVDFDTLVRTPKASWHALKDALTN